MNEKLYDRRIVITLRTYVQLKLRRSEPPATDENVKQWLETAGWRPQTVSVPDNVRAYLLDRDEIDKEYPGLGQTADDHAVFILSAIPRVDLERAHALATAKFVIHLDDTANNATVWGLVCVDQTSVAIRLRHRSTRSLEHATEELIENAWDHAGHDKLFNAFRAGHRVPVREPLSTADAYSGVILGTKEALVAHAKEERKLELRIGWTGIIAFAFCTIGGLSFFLGSRPDEVTRWVSGAFDRIATTALATSAVSFLGYWFRRQQLVSNPVIRLD